MLSMLLIAVTLLCVPMSSSAIEEPHFEVLSQWGDIEIRQYPPYVVAEVVMTGSAEETGNQGFRILAGYIFGRNKDETKLSMTAPVTQMPVATSLNLTVPATAANTTGEFRVQFVLPAGTTLDMAPRPIDPRIVLREEPARRVAVIRYSGTWSQSNYDTHLARLQDAMKSKAIEWSGAPVYARYNPPFTPWFLRRNEIWLQLAAADAQHAE